MICFVYYRGATQSTVVLLNSAGDILAKVKGPGTNHYLLGRPECERIISEMVNEAKRMAKIPESVPLAAMVCGLNIDFVALKSCNCTYCKGSFAVQVSKYVM